MFEKVFGFIIILGMMITAAALNRDIESLISIIFLIFTVFVVVLLPFLLSLHYEQRKLLENCREYLEDNKVKLGLFIRPALNKKDITLANKYCSVKLNVTKAFRELIITDKILCEEKHLSLKLSRYAILTNDEKDTLYRFFIDAIKKFNYETKTQDILKLVSNKNNFLGIPCKIETVKTDKIFLNINRASEAEFTGIPGVTIAKAKHAAKIRKEKGFFLSVNEFYKAINLEEQFTEQISAKGNKIILNDLPDYKRLNITEE